jgi:hypothetical protein
MIIAALNVVDVSALAGLLTAVVGALYTIARYSGDRRGGRIDEQRFYKEVYDDLNKTLWNTVKEQKLEIAQLEEANRKLREAARGPSV